MHIRKRNKVIQLIRTVYDNESKKGRAVLVGHMAVKNPELSADLKGKLTDEETKQVVSWLASRDAQANLVREYAARTLTEQLTHVRAWFKTQSANADNKALAQEIATSSTKLIRQLRVQGLLASKEKAPGSETAQPAAAEKSQGATVTDGPAPTSDSAATFRALKKSKSKKSR